MDGEKRKVEDMLPARPLPLMALDLGGQYAAAEIHW